MNVHHFITLQTCHARVCIMYALMYVYHVLALQTYHTCVCFNVRLPCIDPPDQTYHTRVCFNVRLPCLNPPDITHQTVRPCTDFCFRDWEV